MQLWWSGMSQSLPSILLHTQNVYNTFIVIFRTKKCILLKHSIRVVFSVWSTLGPGFKKYRFHSPKMPDLSERNAYTIQNVCINMLNASSCGQGLIWYCQGHSVTTVSTVISPNAHQITITWILVTCTCHSSLCSLYPCIALTPSSSSLQYCCSWPANRPIASYEVTEVWTFSQLLIWC